MPPSTNTPTGTGPRNVTGTGFDVTPAALTGAAGAIDAEAVTLDEAAAALAQRLGQLGRCWGDDAVGQRFAAGYGPAAQVVVGNIDALSIGLVRIAAALRAVAASYERADTSIATTAIDASTTPRAIEPTVPAVPVASITPLMSLVELWGEASRSSGVGNGASAVAAPSSIAVAGNDP